MQQRLAALLGAGWGHESAAVLAAVEAHREYWRPDEVRVLLLAESHVRTHRDELAAKVSAVPWGCPDAPCEFVRLVYCLGNGEGHLLSAKLSNSGGTP